MKALHILLEISPALLEEIRLKTYVEWCMLYNNTPTLLQAALSSSALQKYFAAHYNALEEQFAIEIQDYTHLEASDKNEYYAEVTNRIFKNYPGALLPKMKKAKVTHQNQN